jgi:hypothetical protein
MRRAFTVLSTVLFALTLFAYPGLAQIPEPPADRAVFHQNGDCNSANQLEVGVGEYNNLFFSSMTPWFDMASWNDQISCITIGSEISKVIVFENTNFGGKRKEFSRTYTNPFGARSFAGGDWWNDKISSLKVIGPAPANNVVFYQDGDYNGNQIQLHTGEYKDLRSYDTGASGTPDWNDKISSMKIGTGITKVTVYWDINCGGKSREFKRQSDNPDGCWSLTGDGWNDKISSIKVE